MVDNEVEMFVHLPSLYKISCIYFFDVLAAGDLQPYSGTEMHGSLAHALDLSEKLCISFSFIFLYLSH